jgi:hypothetical protein
MGGGETRQERGAERLPHPRGGGQIAAHQGDAARCRAGHGPVGSEAGGGGLEAGGGFVGVPVGDPGEQPAAAAHVDGEAVAAPAGGGGVRGVAVALERLAQQDADALLAQLPLTGLGEAGQGGGQVRPVDDDRVVAVAKPFGFWPPRRRSSRQKAAPSE